MLTECGNELTRANLIVAVRQRLGAKPGEATSPWYNAGIYALRPSIFDFTAKLKRSPRGEYELTDAINAMVKTGHPIAGMAIEGRWVDVRDPDVLASLERKS